MLFVLVMPLCCLLLLDLKQVDDLSMLFQTISENDRDCIWGIELYGYLDPVLKHSSDHLKQACHYRLLYRIQRALYKQIDLSTQV